MRFSFVMCALLSTVSAQKGAYDAILLKDGKASAVSFQDACYTNIDPIFRPILNPIVAAIRYAENGRKGREYGILHTRVKPTYRSQAGWCAATVQKNFTRWLNTKPADKTPTAFITFLGSKYCPVGADNDPTGLNKHWIKNVKYYYYEFQ